MSTAQPAAPHITPPSRRRIAKRLLLALELLLLLALIVFLSLTIWLRRGLHANLAQLDGEQHVSGLKAPVTVTRDAHGVPSITAASLDDLLFAQGYLTATDRLWQMDAVRRHGAGELAEILGSSLVDHDRRQRYLQMRAAADRALSALPADQLHQLSAYADGVNAYIASHARSLPIEFRVLHYTPAPWIPRDSLLIALVMNQDLATSFPQKLNREALASHLPAALINDLYPVGSWRDFPPMQQPVDLTQPIDVPEIPLDNTQSSLRAKPHDLLATNTALLAESCEACRAGSNNWAVAGSRSASGAPLLSNDMHLSLSVPAIWYEAALHTSDHVLDVEGFTLPGVPFVIAGRNEHVAWGFTNTGSDVQDVYVEHTRNNGDQIECEQPDGAWLPVVHHEELIRVRGGRNITLDVLTTKHPVGNATIETPIISPLYPSEQRTLALAWNIYDPDNIRAPFLAINTARDAASLVVAFSGFPGPAQNLVYADAQHIGYHALGRIPIRGAAVQHPRTATPPLITAPSVQSGALPTDEDSETGEAGLIVHAPGNASSPEEKPAAPVIDYTIGFPIANVPVDALNADAQWSGYIPYDALPQITDPPAGILATANARITPDDYPYFLTNNWTDPYRVQRIRKLLDGRSHLTPADMLRIQNDTHSELDLVLAQRFAYAIDHASPAALKANVKRLHQAADILRDWHGDLSPTSAAASITVAARTELWSMLLEGRLRANGITDKNQIADLIGLYIWGERYTALERLVSNQPSRWLPAQYGSWNDLLTAAVERGLENAPRNLDKWDYGTYHPVEIAHPVFGSHSLLSTLLGSRTGTGIKPNGGDATTVRAAGLHFGPSERFTADLSSPDTTFANIFTGESGNPRSPFFLDQFPGWLESTTLPLPLRHPSAEHTLTLLPQ
jgi:penicillin amidase